MGRRRCGEKTKRNRLSRECYIDGREYPSLFALAIDFEVNYGWLWTKLLREGGSCVIKGHLISVKDRSEAETKKEAQE